MRLFLIRHGEMAGDPYVRPGRPVSGCLTPQVGVGQARRAAQALCNVPVEAVLASSYGRALQTAEIIFGDRGVPIEICDFLCEWLPSEEVRNMETPEFEERMEREANLRAEERWKTDLGEGKYEMYARVVPPLLTALATHGIRAMHGGYVPDPGAEDRCLAIVAHGGSLDIVLSYLINRTLTPWSGISFALTGVAELVFTGTGGVYYPQLTIPPWCPAPQGDSD
ncbi:MAG: histidine phosphatase family protein [Spirochaetales bacterium]|nr:MAG: histidine phosphatase family protein [Spirochaetales bacterium]